LTTISSTRKPGLARRFFADRIFFRRLFHIALPIMLQNFFTSVLNMVGVVMIGQLGDTAVAAVGLANQVNFLVVLMLFGITSGAGMFIAQLWGTRDIPAIRHVLGLALTMALSGSSIFAVLAIFFPGAALSFYTEDQAVIALGSGYLRLIGPGFLLSAVSFSFAATLRSTGDVRTPLAASSGALVVNAILSYLLIFGKLGLPQMGVAGAGVAVLIARVVECGSLLLATYLRRLTPSASLREMFSFDRDFAGRVFLRALPVAVNEVLWSLGVTTYNAVYARIGTEAIAAVNIAATVESLAFVIFLGITDASAILVGNTIGAGDEQEAFEVAWKVLFLGVSGALGMGVLILTGSNLILRLYKVSPEVIAYAQSILQVMGLSLWVRVSNLIIFIGILRSGGDTRYAFLVDGLSIWLVGVPSALAGAFLFHLSVPWVYLMITGEEFFKLLIVSRRFLSRKWIHNLTRHLEVQGEGG